MSRSLDTLPELHRSPAHGPRKRARQQPRQKIKTDLEIEDQNFILRRRNSVQQPCLSDHKSVMAVADWLKII
jgi:hypothetical protein